MMNCTCATHVEVRASRAGDLLGRTWKAKCGCLHVRSGASRPGPVWIPISASAWPKMHGILLYKMSKFLRAINDGNTAPPPPPHGICEQQSDACHTLLNSKAIVSRF